MKFTPWFIVVACAVSTIGCKKKSSPDFEARVQKWEMSECSCAESEDPASCVKAPRPDTEGSSLERFMIREGVMTDEREPVIARAEKMIAACGQGAVARRAERKRAREMRDMQRALENPNTMRDIRNQLRGR